jgi:hypothetical protein
MFHFVTFCEGDLEVKQPERQWAETSLGVENCAENAAIRCEFNAEAKD